MGSQLDPGGRSVEIRIPMKPDEAKSHQQSLSFLLLARPATDTTVRTNSMDRQREYEPTLASPTTWEGRAFGIHVNVFDLQVWVVELESGAVLAKTTFAEMLRMKRAGG
jgi:hypothetical protein